MLGPVVLPGRAGVYELELVAGKVAAIRPTDARRGRLVLPSFVDPHVHADRAFAAASRAPRSLADAVELAREVKLSSSEQTVRGRA